MPAAALHTADGEAKRVTAREGARRARCRVRATRAAYEWRRDVRMMSRDDPADAMAANDGDSWRMRVSESDSRSVVEGRTRPSVSGTTAHETGWAIDEVGRDGRGAGPRAGGSGW